MRNSPAGISTSFIPIELVIALVDQSTRRRIGPHRLLAGCALWVINPDLVAAVVDGRVDDDANSGGRRERR